MIVHWHLLAEQLQQHPEQLEEELRDDVAALAGQAESVSGRTLQPEPMQERDVLRRLQSRLGNFALQQLLSGQSVEQQLEEREEERVEVPMVDTAKPEAVAPATEAEVAEAKAVSEEQTVAEVAAPRPALEPGRRAALLLRQILIGLPDLPVPMLAELAGLVEQAPERKAAIVETLERRINDLSPAAREELLSLIDRLPQSLTRSSLMAALLARLRTISPVPPPPPPPAPEE